MTSTPAMHSHATPAPVASPFWTLDRAAEALADHGSVALPRGDDALAGVTTDTRAIVPGMLFVALRGERFDAHDFLADAVERGAAALVVSDASRAAGLGVPVYAVHDTVHALGALGRYRRRAWGKPVLAVAGSNGKTSTKELLRAALGAAFDVHVTEGNLNNQIGVPLTLLALRDDAEVAVVEMGTNMHGEIALLRAIVEPSVTVLTSIGEEHLEGLGDLAGVLREESASFDGVPLAITPASQPEVADAARGRALRVLEAGLDTGDVRPTEWGIDAEGRGWLVIDGETVRPALRGVHNLRNAMLALAAARELGVSTADAARGLATMAQPAMRSAWESLGTVTLVNDAYNANPGSTRAAIDLLDATPGTRQRVLVLGTMRELGDHAERLHRELAERALASSADVVAGVGDFAGAFTALAPSDPRVVVADDVPELWALLAPRLRRDALVLLKGSRGVRLERLVPPLTEWAAGAESR